jgi:primosomal replication protein N
MCNTTTVPLVLMCVTRSVTLRGHQNRACEVECTGGTRVLVYGNIARGERRSHVVRLGI